MTHTFTGLEEKIQALADPILAEAHMELVELTCRLASGQMLVRFLVDKPGGVMLSMCASVNRRVTAALEQANVIEGPYTVEVSSPGLDRPLTTKRDFERAIGEEVRLELVPEDGRYQELQGIVLAVQPEAVVMKMPSGNETIPLSQIRVGKKPLKW